jgi:hypothetical protein
MSDGVRLQAQVPFKQLFFFFNMKKYLLELELSRILDSTK